MEDKEVGEEEDAEAAGDAADTAKQPDGWHKASKARAEQADAVDPQRRPHGNATTIGTTATVVATTLRTGTTAKRALTTCVTQGTTKQQANRP